MLKCGDRLIPRPLGDISLLFPLRKEIVLKIKQLDTDKEIFERFVNVNYFSADVIARRLP
jgi:hypothetical protein